MAAEPQQCVPAVLCSAACKHWEGCPPQQRTRMGSEGFKGLQHPPPGQWVNAPKLLFVSPHYQGITPSLFPTACNFEKHQPMCSCILWKSMGALQGAAFGVTRSWAGSLAVSPSTNHRTGDGMVQEQHPQTAQGCGDTAWSPQQSSVMHQPSL